MVGACRVLFEALGHFCKLDGRMLGHAVGCRFRLLFWMLFEVQVTGRIFGKIDGSMLGGMQLGCWHRCFFGVLYFGRVTGGCVFCEIDGRVPGAMQFSVLVPVLFWDAVWCCLRCWCAVVGLFSALWEICQSMLVDFSLTRYVKQHYLRHGIDCVTWKACRSQALDAKPPSRAPRALAPWLQELLVSEPWTRGNQKVEVQRAWLLASPRFWAFWLFMWLLFPEYM